MPRKVSTKTYDVDGFISQLLASQKFDELTELFANKAAYKIKKIDPSLTDIVTMRRSKNADTELLKDDHMQTELMDSKLRDDDKQSKEYRKFYPSILLKDGELSPNENLTLKYTYITRNAKKNSKIEIPNKKKDDNDGHSLANVNPKEAQNETKQNQKESKGSHGNYENHHNDKVGDVHYKNGKIDQEYTKVQNFQQNHMESTRSYPHVEDNVKNETHSKEEHYSKPNFKSKAYSVIQDHAHNNASAEISAGKHNDTSGKFKEINHVEIDHIKDLNNVRETTTTHLKAENTTTNMNNTAQKDYANYNNMTDIAHFRSQISDDERSQTKSAEFGRNIRNVPGRKLKKIPKKEQQFKKSGKLYGNLRQHRKEKGKIEREWAEKILRNRLKEEDRLRQAAEMYERAERKRLPFIRNYDKEDYDEDKPRELFIFGVEKNILEIPREKLEKKLREGAENSTKIELAQEDKWVKERKEFEKMLKEESEKRDREIKERLQYWEKERIKINEELKEQHKDLEKWQNDKLNEMFKEKERYESQLKEQSLLQEKQEEERLNKLVKEKEIYESQMQQEAELFEKQEQMRLEKIAKQKEDFEKKLRDENKKVEVDKKPKEEEKKVKPDEVTTEEAEKEKKDPEKEKDEEPTKVKEKTEKEKKKEPPKEKKKPKELDYIDFRAEEEPDQIYDTKEGRKQDTEKKVKEYEKQLEKEIREEDESSEELELEVPKHHMQSVQRTKLDPSKVNIEPYKNIEDEYNNRFIEGESAENNGDQRSKEDELVIMQSTTNPMMYRKEGDKIYTFVKNPDYADYHEAYGKMQREHPYNPADFI
ncbi:hypothetical protein HF086_017263 [Spodoptera exigua]|uniref:Uncharacterized protein n=1 Tax=Spodoptera exigua TaxID=7107 RepID=A0A922M0R4_SPOEX|nr:hypothetical protein HF086_017263 [Spodoptera exigua]